MKKWLCERKWFLICLALGTAAMQFPVPAGLEPKAYKLFVLFVTTIFAIIVEAMPMGALCIFALAVAGGLKILTVKECFVGFSNPIILLIVLAFFIARGFIKTGLGSRIAYNLMYYFGKSPLGLCYSLLVGELVLAPAIPSSTARSGGIIYPIAESLCEIFQPKGKGRDKNPLGPFLMPVLFQGNAITSAMFLTSMAGNPLIAYLASMEKIEITWMGWATAALLPGLACFILMPMVMYLINPPQLKETKNAKSMAEKALKELGPMKSQEKLLIGTFVFLLVGWIAPQLLGGMHPTLVALSGISLLLITNVLTFNDIKSEKGAWDTFVWFSTLVTFASFLKDFGFFEYFIQVSQPTNGSIPPQLAFVALTLIYFWSHYLFASSVAHISAMYSAFLGVGITMGLDPMSFALTLGFVSNLFGGLTHYSFGSAPIYFGAGFHTVKRWWWLGFVGCHVNLLLWLLVGHFWY